MERHKAYLPEEGARLQQRWGDQQRKYMVWTIKVLIVIPLWHIFTVIKSGEVKDVNKSKHNDMIQSDKLLK